ncbi:ROK family protein [Candidatus Bathyarchaeota archaeon]|nr:ROK family protein [Candidatus Bathyarchaeota archaeon]
MNFISGVDIGGTSIRVAIAPLESLSMDSIEKRKVSTPKESPLSISTVVRQIIQELLKDNNLTPENLASINIATAGPIDMDKGEVFNNANLGFKSIPLREPISACFPGIPIHLINDCNGAVLGVHFFEALPGEKDNLAYVTLSTGIGGGIVLNGRLLLGKEGNAAEVGHGIVNPNSGVSCNCGSVGCWEAFSSGTAVARHARDGINHPASNGRKMLELAGGTPGGITAKIVFEAARNGDPLAGSIIDQANMYNCIGIGLMNNYYDLEVVYLGGSMMKDASQILPVLEERFKIDPVRYTINKPPTIKKSTLGDEVGILGALALGKYKSEDNQILT